MKLVLLSGTIVRKERNVLFNDTFNIFYLWLYGTGQIVKDHLDSEKENPLLTYMGYSFQLAAKDFLYAQSHRWDSTYHKRCYTSCRALAGTEIGQ